MRGLFLSLIGLPTIVILAAAFPAAFTTGFYFMEVNQHFAPSCSEPQDPLGKVVCSVSLRPLITDRSQEVDQ